MTTTIVYASAPWGFLSTINATYATARKGGGPATVNPSVVYYGQNRNNNTYTVLQAFFGFTWTLPAAERLTSAVVRVRHASTLSVSVPRSLELRGFEYGTSLEAADWRTPTQLAALTLFATTVNVQANGGDYCAAGSDEMLAALGSVTSLKVVAVSSRQRAGTAPTSDEGASLWTDGTADAPALVMTSAPAYSQLRVLGAQVPVPGGGWAMLTAADGGVNPVVTLNYVSATGVVSAISTVPTVATAAGFGVPAGQQALELVGDPAGNL